MFNTIMRIIDCIMNLYERVEKEENLSYQKKVQLEESLDNINSRLKDEESIGNFIINNIDDDSDSSGTIKESVNTFYSFFIIKIVGTIFLTLYFVGILEIIGLMNTVKKEISDSFSLILKDKQRETDFYQNYINENLKMPSFDLFFISAIFSSLFNSFIFPYTVFIIGLTNFVITFFGLGYFKFRTGESLNEKYNLGEIIYIIIMYLLMYLSLGIIALLPFDLLQKGYIIYDKEKKHLKTPNKNGYFFVYLFSMGVSSIIKIIFDRKYVFDRASSIIESKDNDKDPTYFFLNILIIYAISMVSSLIFYVIYICIFKKKEESETSKKAIHFLGYIIYIEETSNSLIDWGVAINKCGNCLGLGCCNCCFCCCTDIDEAREATKKICVIFKMKGILSSLFDLIAGPYMIIIVIMIYIIELINIGFSPELERYLSSNINEKEILAINIISLSSIVILYALNILFGFLIMSSDFFENVTDMVDIVVSIQKSEIMFLSFGLFFFILVTFLINTIISGLFLFKVNKDIIYYFIPFSVSIGEYANICFIYLSDIRKYDIEVIKGSFSISFYKAIYNIIYKLLSLLFDFKNDNLITFQFIFSCIISGISSILILSTIIGLCKSKKIF